MEILAVGVSEQAASHFCGPLNTPHSMYIWGKDYFWSSESSYELLTNDLCLDLFLTPVTKYSNSSVLIIFCS
jgi:hypothetical protein